MKPKLRGYNERIRVVTHTPDSLTMQSHMPSCDIDAIVARFERTGALPENTRQPQYGDVTHLQGDLTEMLNYSQDTIQRASDFKADWRPAPPLPEPDVLPSELAP
ncbi:MAG: internal scaffolding protein [Microvirus sp.]|nr:MAG: internal scaffolding protein [Microvirus sp.]